MIRGIDTEEQFIYEILTLTSLHQLRKIRGIQGTKEKTASALSSFPGHEELLTAYSIRLKA
jgi:hypothetical protein